MHGVLGGEPVSSECVPLPHTERARWVDDDGVRACWVEWDGPPSDDAGADGDEESVVMLP